MSKEEIGTKRSIWFAPDVDAILKEESASSILSISRVVNDSIRIVAASIGSLRIPTSAHAFKDKDRLERTKRRKATTRSRKKKAEEEAAATARKPKTKKAKKQKGE